MGVQGLWELLAPVGSRVSVETLTGKRLAIDASIWMVQFIKAMRDEKGDMVQNAHLIGFFRRICKLLFLRTKPVFVFDGATPALKRRTVLARRRQRENAQTKIRKTAEKLLLNRLKDMRLKEQVENVKNQRLQQNTSVREKKNPVSLRVPVEKIDFMSPAGESGIDDSIKRSTVSGSDGKSAIVSQKYDPKGKGVLLDMDNTNFEQDSLVHMKSNQEKLDEMLAASLAAEEDGNFTSNASTSTIAIPSEEEGSEEDEEFLLPTTMDGNVDPAILASLPPSMQLDLLVQMREKLMTENRQKYQKVKKAPEKFSELQIEAYLKTVAFRREINEVQRTAGGRAVGGVQTSRIASEANREFIFSSSFSGDKEVLASAREGGIDEHKKSTSQQSLPVPVKNVSSLNKSDATTELDRYEPAKPDENIEVYIDERGRLRIRNRHMGIQMTRDIQRNLHLMKEKEKAANDNDETFSTWESFPSEDQFLQNLPVEKDDGVNVDYQNDDIMVQNASSIEISFERDAAENDIHDEDDIFLQLAAGGRVAVCSTEKDPKDDSSPWASDSDWEEMPVQQNSVAAGDEITCENASNSMENGTITKFSKGGLEEEAKLQEAIEKSLLDLHDKQGVNLVIDKPSQDSQRSNETAAEAEKKGILNGITILKTSGAIHEQSDASVPDSVDSQRGITNEVGTHASSGSGVKSVISPGKAFNDPSKSRMAKQPDEFDSESFGGESVEVSASSKDDVERPDFLGEASFHFSMEKCNADRYLSAMMDDRKRYHSRHNSQSHVTESSDTTRDVIKSHIEILSDTDSQKEGREKNTLNEAFSIESSTGLEEKGVPAEFLEANLEEEMRAVDQEYVNLDNEQKRLERNAESVSGEMFAECQELLQIFGIPYIIAPMEAEAQCAFMEQANLVDGIVTDDSDVFLFGARSVYKNIFDDRKYVETYFMKDIEKELGLSRDKLIRMAMLLGSDYTEGISGIGIVNAIEVVTAFPEEDGLQKFRKWVESPDPTILGKADAKTCSNVKKRGSGSVDNIGSLSGVSKDDTDELKKIFMDKHRKVSKNWHIPSTFPSEAVTSAYLNPQVDRSTEVFSWGKPDLSVLRKLCWEKFGWNSKRTEDLLLPVLKEYEKRETQLRMEAFYSFSERFAKIRSKRIRKAVKGIGRGLSLEMADHKDPADGNKKRFSPHVPGDKNQRNCLQKSFKSSEGNKRGRGGGPAQKRGRGKGRSQRNLLSEISDDTSDDGNLIDSQGDQDGKAGNLQKVRRSTRSRNPVKYYENEDDELDESRNKGNSPSENLENEEFLKDERVIENVSPKRTQIGDALINRDSVQMGGGFDAYEAETGDANLEDEARDDDYKVIGGGFCVDEDEAGETDEMQKMDGKKHKSKGKRRDEEDATLEENEIGNSSAGGLSAMPFLKRKKRKS